LQRHLFLQALIVFTVAGVSDGLDGLMARFLNQRTTLGSYLDPIADKMLLASAFVTLTILKLFPFWLTVIVISRDILIMTGIIICTLANIKVEIKPSMISKWTTVVQLTTVFFILLYQVITPAIPSVAANLLFIACAVITIISGLHYTYMGLNIQQ
jgi:cardiolipin synthase